MCIRDRSIGDVCGMSIRAVNLNLNLWESKKPQFETRVILEMFLNLFDHYHGELIFVPFFLLCTFFLPSLGLVYPLRESPKLAADRTAERPS